MDSIQKRADALAVLCCTLFGAHAQLSSFRLGYWAEVFPMEVILYALVETELKQRRTEGMTAAQIAKFAETVMLRRFREEIRKRKVA